MRFAFSGIRSLSFRPLCVRMVIAATVLPICGQTASAQFGGYPGRVQQQRGATVGGLAGAVIGAVIGENNNEAGAGAAIGGVVGAVAGGVLGNAADKERAYAATQVVPARPAAVYQPPAYVPPQTVVGMGDVINMSRSGLSENVIINQIQQRGVATQLQVADIIELHRQGVSENVITTMQRANVGPVVTARVATAPPVVVREHVVVPRQVDVHHFHAPRGRRVYHYGF